MVAFGLSIALFLFWGVLGYVMLTVLHTQRNLLRNMLLAPVVGVATMLLLIFWLNRAGLPVIQSGLVLAGGLLLASLGLIERLRPVIPLRRYLPFAALLLFALFMVGRPMLEYGFDWVSYANDDMANYVLAAHRFLNHGFFEIPDLDDWLHGRDYTIYYWFFLVAGGVRPGSELLLAWIISVSGLTGFQVFMPAILALHLVLISTVGALVLHARRRYLAALLTCGLLGISALTSLGTLYQLIAQVGGISLLTGLAIVLLRSFPETRATNAVRHSVLVAILASALLIMYPEVLPFAGLAFVLYVGLGIVRKRLALRSFLLVCCATSVVTLILLNRYIVVPVDFMIHQVSEGLESVSVQDSLFPYYLIPSGLANLWGFQGIGTFPPEPWQSASIVLGALLLVTATVAAFRQTWDLQPSGIIAVVMLGLGIWLFVFRNDFGLFKLAMYIQPFIIGALVVTWLGVVRWFPWQWQIMPLLLLGLIGLPTQIGYVEQSRGLIENVGRLTEIPEASRGRINATFEQLITSAAPNRIMLDTSSVVLAKFQALYTQGIETAFLSSDFFPLPPVEQPRFGYSDVSLDARSVELALERMLPREHFKLLNEDSRVDVNEFTVNQIGTGTETICGDSLLVALGPQQAIFNRRHFNPGEDRSFFAQPCRTFQNHLIFIRSKLGETYYLPSKPQWVSLYQLERDLFYQDKPMAGIGRILLFQVINPSSPARLELAVSVTLKGDGKNQLPPAAAIGNERLLFPMVGRGSARVFSPPLTPQIITGRSYLGIDMGVAGQLFPDARTGLLRWFGGDVPIDRRRLVGFARDISLISDAEYQTIAPPSQLSSFPADLANPDLEYSGLYEDGWVSEAAFLRLTQPSAPAQLVVRGMIPEIADPAFSSEVRVLVDEHEVLRKTLGLGDFEIRAPVLSNMGTRRIDLRFSRFQQLPTPDNRPATALLRFVGFE